MRTPLSPERHSPSMILYSSWCRRSVRLTNLARAPLTRVRSDTALLHLHEPFTHDKHRIDEDEYASGPAPFERLAKMRSRMVPMRGQDKLPG
jgi:hypothetical protein